MLFGGFLFLFLFRILHVIVVVLCLDGKSLNFLWFFFFSVDFGLGLGILWLCFLNKGSSGKEWRRMGCLVLCSLNLVDGRCFSAGWGWCVG